MPTIKAVLFDLDNTLTHRDLSVGAYSQRLAEHFQAQLQQRDIAAIKTIVNRIDNGGYPKAEYLTHQTIGASVAHALLQELDWLEPPDAEILTRFWFEQFGCSAVAMPGAEPLLQQLRQRQFKLAVVSNGGHATRLNILQGLGFQDYFDLVVSSEQAGVSKPHPEIFLYTIRQLGVQPQECLFIGDHPVNDVQGATQAGMQALLLAGFHADVPSHVTQITHLEQLQQFL